MTTATIAAHNRSILCKPHIKRIRTSAPLPSLSELFSTLSHSSIIGGNSAGKNAGRFSYWAAEPKDIFEFKGGQANPFEKLQLALSKYKLHQSCKNKLPKSIFCGGWIGYFSYELGRYIEKLPQTTVDDIQMPLVRLCFYDRLIAYDHLREDFWLIALELPHDSETGRDKLEGLEQIMAEQHGIHIPEPVAADFEAIDFSQVRCNVDKDHYLRMVERIKRYIYDGDVYQINFSQRFQSDYNARPIKLFHWQNYYNPCPYSAYIDGGDFHIVSASPEMFITINDGLILTRPIKGTRPYIKNDPCANRKNYNELLTSEKEKAELNMIIDLERNDVARICLPGTRKVTQPRTIETYPSVFHAVATVAGKLREKITFCDILKSMFPGGSITGAPKIRAMEIIDETEPTARGVYTGSIGFIGIDGSACLNIAIRTIIISDGIAYAQTGGGIVADSNPQAEWQESVIKARALLAGIRSVGRKAKTCNSS
jgi:para-aminobenzoate synthetase component 1